MSTNRVHLVEDEEERGLFSRRQVAEMLGRHYTTIRRWEKDGRIKVHSYIGTGRMSEPRFTGDEVARLRQELAASRTAAPAPAAATEEDVQKALRDLGALQAENDVLRDSLRRERSLLDRLLGKDGEAVRS
jgi:transposase